ncbi:hypothetical protein O181_001693 [Austropuccinia psidii MF-1]|uniref:Uncharacterized protein n=1 Tax=Austropuccinia psidii MF-1 TaxID=1389203 RepID=A0A9Q3GBY4_9BASI|nr:hypothetical protein [Austropuccinia psidii MF-1]
MTALLLETWTICQIDGGKSLYIIEEDLNKLSKKIAIVSKWITSRRPIWKNQIQEPMQTGAQHQHERKNSRQEVVIKLFIKDFPETSALFLGDGIMSDSEDALLESSSNTYSWRSSEAVKFLKLLNELYCQLGTIILCKRERRTKIEILIPASSWTDYGVIPLNIPSNLIWPEALYKLNAGEKIGLELWEIMNLTPELEAIINLTKKP